MIRHKILVVDDDEVFLSSLKKTLENENHTVDYLSNPIKAVEYSNLHKYDLLISDVKMPGMNGIELMNEFRKNQINIPVVFISGQSTISIAMEAIKLGAFDFLEKPVEAEKLIISVNNALRNYSLTEENVILLGELEKNYRIIGTSLGTKKLRESISQVCTTDAKILITGESGTGKELVAWAIHHHSKRKDKEYIKLNCAAMPHDLLESELFGHKRGSFTGATADSKGKFRAAEGGTIFLDEIGELPIQLQSKLLRVIEEGEIQVVGENKPMNINVRVITATNRELEKEVNEGRFREDLYHRLNVVNIHVPPLRDRTEDIPDLACHFLKHFRDIHNKRIHSFSQQALAVISKQSFPGNVRELRNLVEKMVVFAGSEIIDISDVYAALGGEISTKDSGDFSSLKEAKKNFEQEYIVKVLDENNWKIIESAVVLGIDRTHLFRKMQDYGIRKPTGIN
ncbi:MAG: sigma-54 dependent transcriptional regulator [Melioribacteraceae bacterium]|nr:sigma-54 dependent transcriptional regulator [Melioribacteraceae bacterium]MCF8412620.1 sigma-54 dependent transcriptional regulator [Melioribacteraceae bacterium]